jgi:hypothetical protein
MAITKSYINGDASALAEFLNDSGLFGAVTESEGVITCLDENINNPVYVLSDINNSNRLTIQTYYNNGESSTTNGWSGYSTKPAYAYKCVNGVLIDVYSTYGWSYGAVLMTKTNNNEYCIVYSSDLAQDTSIYTSYKAIAYNDVDPMSANSFSSNTKNQTVIAPFATNNDGSKASFTPNAGMILFGQYYSSGYGSLNMGGTTWLTNGYWAIKDE